MQLKIEHLTPYLPFNLTFLMESESESKEPNIYELKSIDLGLKMVNFGWGNAKTLTEIKPILKPIKKLSNEAIIRLKLFTGADMEYFYGSPLSCGYDDLQYLFSNHYDVFGLINDGLATELS